MNSSFVVGACAAERPKIASQTVGPFEPISTQIEFPHAHLRRRQRELRPHLGAAPIGDLLLECGGSVAEIVIELRVLVRDAGVRRQRERHLLIAIAEAVGAQFVAKSEAAVHETG